MELKMLERSVLLTNALFTNDAILIQNFSPFRPNLAYNMVISADGLVF